MILSQKASKDSEVFENYESFGLSKIIRIEEPTYTLVYEQVSEQVKEMKLEEIEKELGYKIKIKESE